MNSEPLVIDPLNSPFRKEISVPSSKSYANRLLVLAAITKEDVVINNLSLSSDVLTMASCLEKIGLDIVINENKISVRGSFPECEKNSGMTLNTGDGGTTNRFLIPLLARGSQEYEIVPEGHMRNRPMAPLVDALSQLGCHTKYNEGDLWISIKGPFVTGAKTKVECSSSTQFLTGLSLACVDHSIELIPVNLKVSLPYWELTLNLLDQFKAGTLKYENPVDFSSLTYPLALAAVRGEVIVNNAHIIDNFQADSKFIGVLKEMGAKLNIDTTGLTCSRGELKSIEFDGSQCPDAIPTLLYVCSFAKGRSRLYNLEVLIHKECDRFHEMIRIMKAFGIKLEVDEQKFEIIVHGKTGKKNQVSFCPAKDHRMVMVAFLFMKTLGGGALYNTEYVAKSFTNFFEVMN